PDSITKDTRNPCSLPEPHSARHQEPKRCGNQHAHPNRIDRYRLTFSAVGQAHARLCAAQNARRSMSCMRRDVPVPVAPSFSWVVITPKLAVFEKLDAGLP